MGVSVYWTLGVLCVFIRVPVWYQIRVLAKNHIMCQTSVNLTCIISLNKITHQIRRNHPFNQRNKETKRTVGVEVGGEGTECTKYEKGGGVDNIRGSS